MKHHESGSMSAALGLTLALLAVVMASGGVRDVASADVPRNNNRLSNALTGGGAGGAASSTGGGPPRTRDWVKISAAPATLVTVPEGGRLELECEAVGSPAPTLRWLRAGIAPLSSSSYSHLRLHHGQQSAADADMNNSILDAEDEPTSSGVGAGTDGSVSLAKIRARLVVESVTAAHQGRYACVAHAGARSASSAVAVLVVESRGDDEPGDLAPQVRVTLHYAVLMTAIGEDVTMPCHAAGVPLPDVYWLDAGTGRLVSASSSSSSAAAAALPGGAVGGDAPRMRVLADGSLRIRRLAWSDMGAYTCVAANAFAKDTATTFLYPALKEDQD